MLTWSAFIPPSVPACNNTVEGLNHTIVNQAKLVYIVARNAKKMCFEPIGQNYTIICNIIITKAAMGM